MKINRQLHLVIPIAREDGSQIHVHSTPIASEVFDIHYKVIAKAHAEITAGGYGFASGPRIAAKLLRDAAKNMGVWEGPTGVERTLIGEIERLTNVFIPNERTGRGWDLLPLEEAIRGEQIDKADAEQVRNALCFFCLGSCMYPRAVVTEMLEGAAQLWGAQITLLSCTEFQKSLPTSIETASTGEKVPA